MSGKCPKYCCKIIEKQQFIDGALIYTQLSDSGLRVVLLRKQDLTQYILAQPFNSKKEQTSSGLIQF
jgi:hypothetical protein